MIRALLVVLLLATTAHADLADRCCKKLGLGCSTPAPTPAQTPDLTGCRRMTENAASREWSTSTTFPSADLPDCWWFSVPPNAVVVAVGSQNTSNTQCGNYGLKLVDPTGDVRDDESSQPAANMLARPGKWRVYLNTVEPCGKYGIIVRARY